MTQEELLEVEALFSPENNRKYGGGDLPAVDLGLAYQPPPLEVLPEVLRSFVQSHAEAIGVDPSQATDVDGLAGQLERLLTPEPEPAPAAEESVDIAEIEESPPDESSSDEQPEEGGAEDVLSQAESEDSTEVEPAADADSPSPQKGLLRAKAPMWW